MCTVAETPFGQQWCATHGDEWPCDHAHEDAQPRECWSKTGFFTGDRYCGAHGRLAGWPCADSTAVWR